MSANGRCVVKELSTRQLGSLATMVAQLNTKNAELRQLQSEIELINRALNSFMIGLDITWKNTMDIDFDLCAITDKEEQSAVQEPSTAEVDVGEQAGDG